MPAFFTIDTFVRVFILNILHPFPFLLIALYFVALGAPSAEFTRVSFSAPVPTVVPLCASISLALWLLRALLGLDARLAASRQQRQMRWKEEVMLITGGLGGLGGLLAEVYAMRGIPVAIADVTEIDAARQKALADTGIRYWRCDIGDRKQVESMAKEIKKELGAPTILINNAAVACGKQFLDLTPDEIERVYRTNLTSHYHTIQTFLPAMLQRPSGGTIVTVSSVLGHLGCAGLSAYASSKSALTALHRSLAAELQLMPASAASRPRAISTLLVTPGQLSTPLFAGVRPPSTFLGPTVEVQELARAMVQRIDAGQGGELSLPLYAQWIGVLGLLPPGLGGLVRRLAGLDRAGWDAFVLRDK